MRWIFICLSVLISVAQATTIQITGQYTYSPYGATSNINQSISTNHGNKQPLNIKANGFSYTGQAQDPSTDNMTLGGFRQYSPALGRFIQADTYTPFMKIVVDNAYAYVKANPLKFVDLTGHGLEEWNVGGEIHY